MPDNGGILHEYEFVSTELFCHTEIFTDDYICFTNMSEAIFFYTGEL